MVVANLHSVLPLLPLLELLHLLFPGLVDVEHEERTRVVLCNLKLIKQNIISLSCVCECVYEDVHVWILSYMYVSWLREMYACECMCVHVHVHVHVYCICGDESWEWKKKRCSHLAGLEPATFRLTAERANWLRHKCFAVLLACITAYHHYAILNCLFCAHSDAKREGRAEAASKCHQDLWTKRFSINENHTMYILKMLLMAPCFIIN